MWTDCPQVLDEPVKILGLEPEDFAVVAITPVFLALLCDALTSFGGTALVGAALYFAKRGRPPGALFHTLHALELTRLPGVLGPKRQCYSAW